MFSANQKKYKQFSPLPNIITFPLLCFPPKLQINPNPSKPQNSGSSPKLTDELRRVKVLEPLMKRKARSNENSPNHCFFEQEGIYRNKIFRNEYLEEMKKGRSEVSDHSEKNRKEFFNCIYFVLKCFFLFCF